MYIQINLPSESSSPLHSFPLNTGEAPPCLPQEVKNCVWPAMGKRDWNLSVLHNRYLSTCETLKIGELLAKISKGRDSFHRLVFGLIYFMVGYKACSDYKPKFTAKTFYFYGTVMVQFYLQHNTPSMHYGKCHRNPKISPSKYQPPKVVTLKTLRLISPPNISPPGACRIQN